MAPVDTPSVHTHALEALEASDLLLATAPTIKLPPSAVYLIDQVTPEWLTTVLAPSVPNAAVESINPTGGHEGMTSRHMITLHWNAAGTAASLPTHLFIKATPEDPHLREMLSLLHMAELESHVYNDLSPDLEPEGLIPKCYYARAYPGGRFMILLEDLSARGVTVHWMGDEIEVPYAKQVAVALAKIHAKYWNSPRFDTDMVWVRPRSRRFGEQWLRAFLSSNRKKFLLSPLGVDLPEETKELIRVYDENATKLHAYWDARPPTLVHGDSHLGNVLEYADGSAGYYDWQCLFRGYGYRDLSYFLMSALELETCQAHEREIFDLYTDTLAERGMKVDREEAWADYCLLCLERFDSAMTSSTNGGYGHKRSAFVRQVRTIDGLSREHNVRELLERVVATGKILP